jgi:hypothetical protein
MSEQSARQERIDREAEHTAFREAMQERSEPAAASVPLRQQVEEAALAYHKATDGTGEGEYGCPGVTCPGVQRLANFWFPFIARALSSAPTGAEGPAKTWFDECEENR